MTPKGASIKASSRDKKEDMVNLRKYTSTILNGLENHPTKKDSDYQKMMWTNLNK